MVYRLRITAEKHIKNPREINRSLGLLRPI